MQGNISLLNPTTGLLVDSSHIDLLSISGEHRLRMENLPYDIDVWYPKLAEFTFKSLFLPIESEEAIAIMNYQNTRFNGRPKLTSYDVKVLKKFEVKIDHLIKSHFGKNGAFLRLCGRSPKDGEPFDRKKVIEKYNKVLEDLLQKGNPLNANTKLQAIAQVQWLQVKNGVEAMSLLLTSERVFADFHDWLQYGEPEQIVLREWEPQLSLQYEFRVFVNKNKVTAISQYDHYCIYPELTNLKEKIQEKILELWEKIHPHVEEERYVMDFAYLPQSEIVIMIELSPFLPCTGPALFKWTTDKDVLENGPLEFRINHTTHPQLESLVEANWEFRWNGEMAPYWNWYSQAIDVPSHHPEWNKMNLMLLTVVPFASTFLLNRKNSFTSSAIIALGIFGIATVLLKNRRENRKRHLLFFYGTLKRNFHWNHKFLSTSKFISEARTLDKYPLVIGDSGVPYLLGDLPGQGKNIIGELWLIDDLTMKGLDEYEGTSKGYYERRKILVTDKRTGYIIQAFAYFKISSSEELRSKEYLEEYTLEFHKKNYKPIKHIWVKQKLYLSRNNEITNTNLVYFKEE